MSAMKKPLESKVRFANSRPLYTGLVVAFGSAIMLSACSKVPDAVNPAAWYRSATDSADASQPATSGNDLQADRNTPPPGADGATPNLSRIDQQMAERAKAQGGLSADTAGRKYADSVQRQNDAPTNSLYAEESAPAAPKIEAQQIAPAPQPTKPVTTAEVAPAQPSSGTMVTKSPQLPSANSAATTTANPDANYGVDPGMRERLAKQLAEIQARAADQGSLLPSDMSAYGNNPSTVIISSGGVETSGASGTMQFQGGQPKLNVMPTGGIDNNGALPLPASSTRVATILFGTGSAGLDASDRKILAEVAQLQRQHNSVVRVVGHASQRTRNMDPVVHKRANLQVSVKRANQVASELQKMGISSNMILTAAVGDNDPLYLEVMPSGEAGNRRTEIYLSN